LLNKINRYLPGDLHAHTFLSDGSHLLGEVLEQAFHKYNLDWLVISDHGGAFNRDPKGVPFSATSTKIRGEQYGKKGQMWRSQSIVDYGHPEIEKLKKYYPNKLVLHGLEYNLPLKGNVGVYIDKKSPESLAEFEYTFDYLDHDQSLGLPKYNKTALDAIKAARKLEENFLNESFYIINHPHVYRAFTPRLIRRLNDVAPGVVNGFEGLPGHQYRKGRGYYLYETGEDFRRYRLYGGADYMLAKVGGLWDSLLGEGRRFFVFAGSDFHIAGDDLDPFPGEYSKTYLYFETLDTKELIKSVKNGRAFVVLGDIVQGLDFTLEEKSKASLGEQLFLDSNKVVVAIKVKVKDPSSLDHIDLIEGEVGKKCSPQSKDYDNSTNPTTKVALRIYKEDMKEVEPGILQYKNYFTLNHQNGYLRLRGTNLPLNTKFETDFAGNPLIDDHDVRRNTKEIVLKDCWFYSNPIFYSKIKEV